MDEVAPSVYRISTPVTILPGGFSFNQYLVKDEQPLLFHTGPRRMFPLVREAIAAVMPVERLRYVAFSHVEADECGSLNELLAAAPGPSRSAAHRRDGVDERPGGPAPATARGRRDREPSGGSSACAGSTPPHLPHGWECGYLFEETDGHALLWRPLHPAGRRARAFDHGRHPWAERGDALRDGLLRPCEGHPRAPREAAATKPRRSPACTAAPGRGMADGCSPTLPTCFHHL